MKITCKYLIAHKGGDEGRGRPDIYKCSRLKTFWGQTIELFIKLHIIKSDERHDLLFENCVYAEDKNWEKCKSFEEKIISRIHKI